MLTYYDILGVSSKADQNEIKEAYRKLQKKYHPDVYQGGDLELATEKIKQVNEAYSVLSDETKKAEYDQRMFGVIPKSGAQPSYQQSFYAQQKAQQQYYEQQQAQQRYYEQQQAQQNKVNQEFFDRMWKIYYQQPKQKEQEPDYNDPFRASLRSLLKYFAIFFGITLLLRYMGFPVFFLLF